jgi:pSer/pThr/pTyr-binding forkhead associated (FHA) protein
MRCVLCDQWPASTGLMCEECHDELSGVGSITPEQILSHAARPSDAALIDLWGRPWRLDDRTLIGRDMTSGLTILESSISRHHAQIGRDLATGHWILRDLGSSNHSALNDQPVTEPTTLRAGDRITFGAIGFYFLPHVGDLPPVTLDPKAHATIRPAERAAPAEADASPFTEREITNVGLPTMRIRLHEPSGGGGGIVEIRDHKVQMTATQFELFRVLIQRMVAEAHQPSVVRGFVRSSELLAELSWDTHDPADTNVKQLVRRTRRVLIKAEIGDLIEARQRFGYRLRVVPKLD